MTVHSEPPTTARLVGARYRVDLDNGQWWQLGWDRDLATFSAELHDPVPYDPFTPPDLLEWHGRRLAELPDVAALEEATGLMLPRNVAAELHADRVTFPPEHEPRLHAVLDANGPAPAAAGELAAWVALDPDRQTDHLDLGRVWIGDAGDVRRLAWVPETGEVYAVDAETRAEVLGVIPTRGLVDAALQGGAVRHGVEGGLHWARAAVRAAEEEVLFGRVGGWDTDYAAWLTREPARRVPHYDFGSRWTGEEGMPPHRVSWVPTTGELYEVEMGARGEGLVEPLGVFPTAAAVEEAAGGWAARMDEPGSLYWLRDTVGRSVTERFDLARQHPDALARRALELDAREDDLARRERQLLAQQEAVAAMVPGEPRWTLPVAPVSELLIAIQAATGDDMPDVARGCGLDPAWAADVVAGRITDVDVPHVQEVCEGLHCSPFDLWGEDDARGILHAYGPELWPRLIEPLEPAPIEPPVVQPPDLSL